MITASVLIFAAAAIFGVILLTKVLKGQATPKVVVLLHGVLAATGLVLLLVHIISDSESPFLLPFLIFLAAAAAGFFLVAKDLMKKIIPKGVAILHEVTAVVAYLILLFIAYLK